MEPTSYDFEGIPDFYFYMLAAALVMAIVLHLWPLIRARLERRRLRQRLERDRTPFPDETAASRVSDPPPTDPDKRIRLILGMIFVFGCALLPVLVIALDWPTRIGMLTMLAWGGLSLAVYRWRSRKERARQAKVDDYGLPVVDRSLDQVSGLIVFAIIFVMFQLYAWLH